MNDTLILKWGVIIKKLSVFLALLAFFLCVANTKAVMAEQDDAEGIEVTINGLNFFVDSQNETATLISGTSKKIKKLTVPDTISYEEKEIPVVAVEEYAFFESKKLKTVALGKNVRRIGEAAFAFSQKLKKISVPGGLTEIDDAAFAGCIALKKTGIGKNTKIKRIGEGAFAGTAIIYFSIPNYTDEVGSAAFSLCQNLKKIRIGTNCDNIGEGAFSGCDALDTITVSKYNRAFKIIDGIIYSADGMKLIAAGAANGDITVQEGTESILPYAFEDNTRVTSVILPDSLSDICENAFLNATGLEKISFGLGIKQIGLNAFYGCSGLKTVVLQFGKDNIEGYPFENTDDGIQVIQG
ncbi:MAG: leucine-rich repeat domain-containing protein [Lachnospiraceae bacterium]|nr:leucine-rich repeat domain-containing protein [Lachnospiraceae bacterium]